MPDTMLSKHDIIGAQNNSGNRVLDFPDLSGKTRRVGEMRKVVQFQSQEAAGMGESSGWDLSP